MRSSGLGDCVDVTIKDLLESAPGGLHAGFRSLAFACMKVFISWSGETSHKVALVLRDWIPSVLQSVTPYVSSEDIDKGTRWSTDIAKELEESRYGVLVLTHGNLDAPWLNFEAGALSKAFDKSNVSPFLFKMKRSDVKPGPLLQFQSTISDHKDVKKLLHSLNSACEDNQLDEARLESIFEVWWPKLEEQLDGIPPDERLTRAAESDEATVASAGSGDILEELLDLARTQQRILRDPAALLPADYVEHVLRRAKRVGRRSEPHRSAVEDVQKGWGDLEIEIEDLKSAKKRTMTLKRLGDLLDPIRPGLVHILRTLERPSRHRPGNLDY